MQKQSCQKLCFFRIHAKWYVIPVGRDALIPPQRNLADYDKRQINDWQKQRCHGLILLLKIIRDGFDSIIP